MYKFSISTSTLILLTTTFLTLASAQSNSQSSAVSTQSAVPTRFPDACGPQIQPTGSPISYQPLDTCNTAIAEVYAPATFGFFLDNNTDYTYENLPHARQVNRTWTHDCIPLVSTVCSSLTPASAGKWIWNGAGQCDIGFWLSSDPAAAKIPSQQVCQQNILGPIITALSTTAMTPSSMNNRASVNIVRTGFPGKYGAGTGSQANAGYMSWIVQPEA